MAFNKMLAKGMHLIEFENCIFFSILNGELPLRSSERERPLRHPLFKFLKDLYKFWQRHQNNKVGGSSDMIMYPIVYLKRFFSKMLPKGMYQNARIEFQKMHFFLVLQDPHPPSDTSLSTQARNAVLVLHVGYCLYSTPPPLPGKSSPGSASVCHLYHSC